MMEITIWGSRGSIPVSGSQCYRYGGSTTCIEVRLLSQTSKTPTCILFDCGSGITALGKHWGNRGHDILLLQTHMHWDHIQGFPFFRPLFSAETSMNLWCVPREGHTFRDQLSQQMSPPAFPVGLDILPAQLHFHDLPIRGSRTLGELQITWCDVAHPSGNTAFRLDYQGYSVVFSGDVELKHSPSSRRSLQQLAQGATLLIMDAQYLPAEYPSRRGFGHSTPEDAVKLALRCGVSQLLLTHHDPSHSDAQLDAKQALARQYAAHDSLQIDNAYDTMTLHLGQQTQRRACA